MIFHLEANTQYVPNRIQTAGRYSVTELDGIVSVKTSCMGRLGLQKSSNWFGSDPTIK